MKWFATPADGAISWDAIRLAPLHFQSRAVTIGFPGAGNVLASAICAKAFEEAEANDGFGLCGRSPGAKAAILTAFWQRHTAMKALLQSALPPQAEGYFMNDKCGACNFIATLPSGDFLMVRDLDLALYLNTRVHTTHEMPTSDAFAFYRSKGIKTFLAIRHPLAVLASFAAKGRGAADATARRDAASAGFSHADFARARRLGSRDWIRRSAHLLQAYYRPVVDLLPTLSVARFEDAFERPVGYVEQLAQQLGVALSNNSAATIAQVIGTTPLAPDHFNKPSLDGWRGQFTQTDLEAIAPTGLFDTFESLGYSRPHAADLRPMSNETLAARALAGAEPRRGRCVSDFEWDYRALIGTFDARRLAAVLGAADSIFTHNAGEFQIVASDARLMADYVSRLSAAALATLRGGKFRDVLRAARGRAERLAHRYALS